MSKKAENYRTDMAEAVENLTISSPSISVLPCSKIVCYNQSAAITRWALYTKSTRIHLSPNLGENESWTLDLNALNVTDGTQFVLKAIVVDKERTGNIIIEYSSASNITVNYRLERNKLNPLLVFLGTTIDRYKK